MQLQMFHPLGARVLTTSHTAAAEAASFVRVLQERSAPAVVLTNGFQLRHNMYSAYLSQIYGRAHPRTSFLYRRVMLT